MTVTVLDPSTFDWHRGAGGADDVRRIIRLSEEHDGRGALDEAAVLALRNRGLADGRVVAAELDGAVEGFAYVHGLGSGQPAIDLVVNPDARRQGLGLSLAEAALGATGRDARPTAWAHGNHPGSAVLAKHCGFEAVRELWLMRRPGTLAMEVAPPDGFTIRPYRPGQDDTAFLDVNAAAFASHPEQGALDRRGLLERMAEPWFDPEGFLVAEHDGQLVGFHWTKVHQDGRRRPACGEVYVIGVAPDAQGSGIGRALLAAGLGHLRRKGLGEVILYVEAKNDGAVRMYEKYGFSHAPVDTDVMYART
jgi:mycothiol synthase